ncbi:TonB-dependent receptor [Fulvivirgaceae bacterium BMA10]|uniref:TonB-dependent receptor n=1 Tax=Splendidivirga corallicola TaxID=3051826 RepID=A0ABT8KI37_9BACT|nr:TonB-dependent receptor [Fulvivirgaceae bacterium BMA10]
MTIKRIIILLMCLVASITWLFAQNKDVLDTTIKLKRMNGTILEFLNELDEIGGINFSYDESSIPEKRVRFNKKEWKLKDLLQELFRQTDLEFRNINGQIILKKRKSSKSKVTINGTIKSASDGEHLLGAAIYVKELNIGTVTNAYGFYSLTLPSGDYTLVFSYIGHKKTERNVSLENDLKFDLELETSISELEEVVILDGKEKEHVENTEMSLHSVKINRIKATPMLAGESDVLKSIQYLPGIQSANEGTANFSVRGGSYDQNLILLDEAPVYNPSHSMGLFSTFNVDAIKDIKVYKGAIPVKYGGRLSSVVDIRMKEGNDKKFSINGGVGLIGSRLTVEGPIGEKVSYLVSGRYGYVGYAANQLAKLVEGFIPRAKSLGTDSEIYFYDLNAKVNIKLNENNRVYFSTYTGDDHFFNDIIFEDNTLDWGNLTGTFRWNHIFSPKLFGNLTLIYSNFDYAYIINNDARDFKWSANFKQKGIKLDFDFYTSPKSTLNFGINLTDHDFMPGTIEPRSSNSVIEAFSLDTKKAIEAGTYISHELNFNQKLSLNYGLRLSTFHNIGAGTKYIYDDNLILQSEEVFGKGEIINSFYGFEPRASVRYLLSAEASLKASYNRTYQYLHLVSNSTVGLPTDVWLPVDNNVKPRSADQIALGYFRNLKENEYEVSGEVYYKWINNVIDYKDNADIFLNQNIETQIRTGEGKAYGLELLVEKNKGRLTGWASYTLSKVERHVPGVNNDKTYSPRYDRRHNFSLVTSYQLNDKWQLSANYSFISGSGITVPQGVFNANNRPFNYYSDRNAFKLPSFHQLDLSAKLKGKNTGRWKSEWIFGVTNAYNRKNVFTFYVDHQENARTRVFKMFLFGLMPSITYNFKF